MPLICHQRSWQHVHCQPWTCTGEQGCSRKEINDALKWNKRKWHIPFVPFEYPEERFGSNIKEFHMSFITAGNQKLSIRSKWCTISCLFESGEMLVHLVGDWVVDLDFGRAGHGKKIRLNRHNIDVVDGPKFFDGDWELQIRLKRERSWNALAVHYVQFPPVKRISRHFLPDFG